MCPHMGETFGELNNPGTIVGYSDTIVILGRGKLELPSVEDKVELLRELESLS